MPRRRPLEYALVLEIAPGILRATQELPLGIDHVHCYFVRLDSGGYLLVDTGLALPGAEEWWRERLAELDGPVELVAITHFHPDHVGGAGLVAELTGAPVHEGELDREQSLRVWGEAWLAPLDEWLAGHGVPDETIDGARAESDALRRLIRGPAQVRPLRPGEPLAGWEPVPLPGHADGQLGLFRDGILIAGDALLADITPNVGLYPGARPDPLGDFLGSLAHVERLAPRLVLSGHRTPIEDARARVDELREHHRARLDLARALLDGGPRTAYELSLELWEQEFPPTLRRMAVTETLAHLERLVREGRARRDGAGGVVSYTGT